MKYVALMAIGTATLAGWSTWFLSVRASSQLEAELRRQISILMQSQSQFLAERAQLQLSKAEVMSLQAEVSTLRGQRAQRELDTTTSHPQTPLAAAKDITETGSTAAPVGKAHERDVASAQRLLAKLGYGPVGTLGAIGPTTRQALELFQYKNGLPVTRELDTLTFEKLFSGTTMTAAQ
jgi:hypothetical protein